jgi:MtrB/PioB family decaheme-associated outer membrane protein
MSPTTYRGWPFLFFLVAIMTAVQSLAGTSPAADPSQAPPTPAAQEQTAQAQSTQEPAAGDVEKPDEAIAKAADAVPPTTLSPPTWLASNRNIDLRLRPNAGIRPWPRSSDFLSLARDPGDGTAMPWSIKTSLSTLLVSSEWESAKFQEYRDVQDGTTAGVEFHLRDGDLRLDLVGRNLGLGDQDLVVDGGKAGKYLLAFAFSETPHHYNFDARSLYAGIGTTQLTISDQIQTDLQSSTTTQEAAGKIAGYVNGSAQSVEIQLQRKKAGVELTLMSFYPFTLRAVASNESRDGVRPANGAFGLGNFEELAWPVDDETRDLRVTLEYAKPESRVYASGTFRASSFDNQNLSLRFDNPYRITDTSTGSVGATFANGPATGRIALPPSNDYQEATVTSVFSRLPGKTTVSAFASLGRMRQNEPLLPFSTNTAALIPGPNGQTYNATDPAALPRATAEAAMNTATAQVRLTSQPATRLHLVGQYRYFSLTNHETPFTMAAFIRADADVRRPATPNGTYAPVLADYNRHTVNAEGSYDLPADTRFTVGYTLERTNRDFREVASMTDHRVKASLNTRVSWLDLKASYERSTRDTSDYIFNQYNVAQGNPVESPVLPFVRKYDEANRERDEVQLIASSQVTETLLLSAMALYGRDDFSKSPFGLLADNHRVYSMDVSYSPIEKVSLYSSYSIEQYSSRQKARQWSPTSVSNPYTRETGFDSNSNWEASPRDDIHTASMGLEANLIPQLSLNVAYAYSKSDGLINYSSPLGVAADDVNAFVPAPFTDVDDITYRSLSSELEYRIGERLALTAGYYREKYSIADITYRGFTYTPRNLAGGINAGLLMGSYLDAPYGVNVFFMRAKVEF